MRRQGWGKIVNVSSMGGRITFPGGAFYHATKHAVEAFSDVLRFEVRPFGIDVAIIEPGIVRTRFDETALDTIPGPGPDDAPPGPYDDFNASLAATVHRAYRGRMSRFSVGPERVARTIERAISAKRSRTRYVIPAAVRGMLVVRAMLPGRGWDAVVRTNYRPPSPGPPRSEASGSGPA